jgi:hypothetical protein
VLFCRVVIADDETGGKHLHDRAAGPVRDRLERRAEIVQSIRRLAFGRFFRALRGCRAGEQ